MVEGFRLLKAVAGPHGPGLGASFQGQLRTELLHMRWLATCLVLREAQVLLLDAEPFLFLALCLQGDNRTAALEVLSDGRLAAAAAAAPSISSISADLKVSEVAK